MATRVETTGRMTLGKLGMRNRARFLLELSRMRDGEVEVVVSRKHAIRTLRANNYYWGVIVEVLSEHTGYTPDEIHDYCKRHFLPREHARDDLVIINTNGEQVETFCQGALTTTRLNKVDFYEFCERIRVWAEQDVLLLIPTPQEASDDIAEDYEGRFKGVPDDGAHALDGAVTVGTDGHEEIST